MKVREMKIADYTEVYRLWSNVGIELKKSDERKEIQRMLDRNPKTCLVGEQEGQIIAAVIGGFDGRRGYIHHLAVLPSFQNQGYGSILLTKLLKKYKEIGVIKVHLFVQRNNKEVIDFYKNHGFIKRTDLIDLNKKLL